MEPTDKSASAQAVQSWLRTVGYPLEFETARVLRATGFDAHQGRSYLDETPAGQKVREVDVLAPIRQTDPDVVVALVAECKLIVDKPWVVLTNAVPLAPADGLDATLATEQGRAFLVERARQPHVEGIPKFLEIGLRHGFSVVTAYRNSDAGTDPAFLALSQVVSAARHVSRAVGPTWSLAWPVVVVDGQLFETVPDAGDEVEATEWQRLLWHGASAGQPVVIDIVRHEFLVQYASLAYQGLRGIQNLFNEKAYGLRREAEEERNHRKR